MDFLLMLPMAPLDGCTCSRFNAFVFQSSVQSFLDGRQRIVSIIALNAKCPRKHETIIFIVMSAMQKKLHRDILICDMDAIQGRSGNHTAILNIVMQLRKCVGHPIFLFPGVEDRSLPPLDETKIVGSVGFCWVLLDKLLTKRLQQKMVTEYCFSPK
jgi:SNF2 family DNA or RNA helicase